MHLIDLTAPLDWNVSVPPGHTSFSFTAIKRIAKGDSSHVSMLPPSLRVWTTVQGGTMRCVTTVIDGCLPFPIVGADVARPRIVLRKMRVVPRKI
jgi:hypothetical protein